MTLYLALLRVQTRLTAGALFGITVAIAAGFAMPWLLGTAGLATLDGSATAQYLHRSTYGSGVLLLAALALGAVSGVAWAEQGSRTRGVYLMTLPLSRWHLLLLEFVVALTLIAAGAMLVYVGGLVAASLAPIPEGLRAYPGALAIRFFVMSMLVASVLFGPTRLAASPDPARSNRVAMVAGGAILLLLFAQLAGVDLLSRAVTALLGPGAPLHVLTGSWTLVDI